MTDALRLFRTPAMRLVVPVVLVAAWMAILMWLWTDETSLSCFEYVPLEEASSGPSCAELAQREVQRFNTWFVPALISGPAVSATLWFALRPKSPSRAR
jgi:hypothetical protein